MTRSRAWAGVFAIALAGLSFTWLARGEQPYPVPTPAPSRMPIEGLVAITNTPEVHVVNVAQVAARQEGAWSVQVSDLPPVRLAAPTFLKAGARYSVLWPGGAKPEVYRLMQLRPDGWAQVEPLEKDKKEAARWINPAMALVIAELAATPEPRSR
jgi:hypothetical protein